MIRLIVTAISILLPFHSSLSAATPAVIGRTVLEAGSTPGPWRLSVGPEGAVFVLDRGTAQLYRVDPSSGKVLWHTDGSESGEPFVDPVWISRPDGFFIFLTDRGLRRVWKIDYRGELRGSIDLPFAADPAALELAQGGQMALYDRAASLVWLLDDSGRPLWSFAPGEGRKSAEPAAVNLSPGGDRFYFLWRPEGEVTSLSLFGKRAQFRVTTLPVKETARFAAALVAGRELFCCLAADGPLLFDPLSGKSSRIEIEDGPVWDVRAAGSGLYLLAGKPLTLWLVKLENGD